MSAPTWQVIQGDSRLIAPTLTATIDAVVTDPPYGMDWNTDSTRFTGGQAETYRGKMQAMGVEQGKDDWGDVDGDNEPFDPTPWLEYPRVVLWGANHYAARLPVGTTLVWIKKKDQHFQTFLSDAEIAWMKGGHGVYCFTKLFPPPSRMVENFGKVAHPCQKPTGLGAWCLDMAKVEPGMTVLDPYMGSGSFGVACIEAGVNYIGIERSAAHIETAKRRLDYAKRGPMLDFGGAS
jgi:DNA modification methylase